MSAVKELKDMIKEKADSGDDLAKAVQGMLIEKPDAFLVRFIRARKYDVSRAFELMKGEMSVCKGYIPFTLLCSKQVYSVYLVSIGRTKANCAT